MLHRGGEEGKEQRMGRNGKDWVYVKISSSWVEFQGQAPLMSEKDNQTKFAIAILCVSD